MGWRMDASPRGTAANGPDLTVGGERTKGASVIQSFHSFRRPSLLDGDFPGGPESKTLSFQCRGYKLSPR